MGSIIAMRVLYLKEKSRSGDRSYRGGVRRERRESPLGEVGIRGKSRSGDRSYRGGVRRESPLGEVGIYGESRDREIAPTGEVSGERGRHWGKLAFRGKSRSGDRSYRGGVRRESPLGEVGIYGEVAIGRSLLQGRCQEREVAIGGSWHLWRGRDREIAPTGEVSGESRHWGKLAFMERSRSGDRSYRKFDRKTYIKV